uniref:Integrase catalytic domain-containing protein n=1 Tax=Vitis vinifera TaxID=29760 RepID=A5C7G7_VITVI|nr:hypothetical protein VITISV_025056 [Vitis vinifera]
MTTLHGNSPSLRRCAEGCVQSEGMIASARDPLKSNPLLFRATLTLFDSWIRVGGRLIRASDQSDQKSDQKEMDYLFAAAMASIQEAIASLGQRIDRLEQRLRQLRTSDRAVTWEDFYRAPVANLPAKFRMPEIERYTGIGCFRIHLRLYNTIMRAHGLDEAQMIMLFLMSLSGVTQRWFTSLDVSCRQTYDDLAQEFLRQFAFNTVIDVSRRELEALRQRPEESVFSFISRWREKISQVINRPSERDQIRMIKRSLHPRFAKHLMRFPHMDFGFLVQALLISPHGDHIPRSTTLELRIRQMEVFGDSNLVLRQIQDELKTREVKVRPYHAYLELLVGRFDDLRYTHLLRVQNQFFDALSTLASMIDIPTDIVVHLLLIELRLVPVYYCLIDEAEFNDGLPWYHDIYQFLRLGAYPEAATTKDKIALRHGLEFILVAIDYFTKWVEAASYARLTSSGVASFIRSHIIYHYGVPHELISDRGVHFKADVDALLQRYGIQHYRSSAYRSQTNGAVEVANKNIKRIRKMARAFKKLVKSQPLRIGDLVLKVIKGLIRDPRGKFRPNWSGPYFIKELTSEGIAWLMDLDGNRFLEPINVDQLKRYYV